MCLYVHVCARMWRAGRGPICRTMSGRITSPHAPAGVCAWQCPPGCVRWMCPCPESRADAPGCRCLWRGMPLPPSVFPSPTVTSPSPITHHGPTTPCWNMNIWDCFGPLMSFQGCPRVPPPRGSLLGGGRPAGCLAHWARILGASFCSAPGQKGNCTRCR